MRHNTVYTMQRNTVQQNTGQYEILQCLEIQCNESVQYFVSRQRCPRVLSCLLPSSPSGRTHATCPQLSASSSPSPLSSSSPSSSSFHRHRHHHHKDHLLLSSLSAVSRLPSIESSSASPWWWWQRWMTSQSLSRPWSCNPHDHDDGDGGGRGWWMTNEGRQRKKGRITQPLAQPHQSPSSWSWSSRWSDQAPDHNPQDDHDQPQDHDI